MNTPRYRRLRRHELDLVLEWAAREGWNPGLGNADGEAFWAADPEGFWGIESQGQLIGSASAISYQGEGGFVGLFIVRPAWRGKGLGRDFWNFFVDQLAGRLRPGASISLDGVFAMQPFYAASGFAFTHRNLRMRGVGQPAHPERTIVELASLPFEKVAAFDRAHFGLPRDGFLKHWLRPAGGLGLGCLEKDELAGCGVIRPCREGFKIGPLFADRPETAEAVYRALASHAAGAPLFLDIPESNPDACELARRHGLKEVFGCARMARGPLIPAPRDRIYGVTSFELG